MIKKLMSKILLLIIFIVSCNAGISTSTYARWATLQDCDSKVEYLNQRVYVKKDGSENLIWDLKTKILNEQATSGYNPYTMTYNAQLSKIKILEAKTIMNNKVSPVHASQIIDLPIASEAKNLEYHRQVSITYPNLKKGANIYLKYQEKNISPYKNLYYSAFIFGKDQYEKSHDIAITSELPLYISVNDPNKALHIKQSTIIKKNKKIYFLKIKQIKPIHSELIDEDEGHFNPKNLSIVSVSSVPNLAEYGKIVSKEYDKIKNQPLPPLYKEIAELAQKEKTLIEKINKVTSLLAEKITYLSDSKTSSKGYDPRSLEEVTNTQLGDCKDFSMGTAAILESIGIHAHVALVLSGEDALPSPTNLPGYGQTDHAIVKVELPSGPLWLEATSPLSIAPYISSNIANRGAIVLKGKHSTYERIPALDAKDQRIVQDVVWNMQNTDHVKIKGTIKVLGTAAQRFAGEESEHITQAKLLSMVQKNFGCGPIVEQHFTLPNVSSKIIHDLYFDYALKAQNSALTTNTGKAVPLFYTALNRLIVKKDSVSDTYLGPPSIMELSAVFKNISAIGRNNLNCNIESPWVNISRTVQYEKNQVVLHQKLELKKSWIEGSQLQSEEYKKLQSDLSQHFTSGIAIIFKPHNKLLARAKAFLSSKGSLS